MKIIGIDIGTTGICGVCAESESGEIIKSVSEKQIHKWHVPTFDNLFNVKVFIFFLLRTQIF